VRGEKEKEIFFSNLKESFFREKELSKGWRQKTREDHE